METIDWSKIKKSLLDTGKAEINIKIGLSFKMRGQDKKLYLDIEAKIEDVCVTS